jgi:carbon-monoxide dehydrogenase medium subunit
MTPLSVVERSAAVQAQAPVIVQTMRMLSNRRVRNVATVGGSLAHADPHMDLPPVLIALGAHVVVTGLASERTVPVEELFAGYYETVLKRDGGSANWWCRRRARAAVSNAPRVRCMLAGARRCVSVEVQDGAVKDARIVVSAATGPSAGRWSVRAGRSDDATPPGRRGGSGRNRTFLRQSGRPPEKQLVRVYVAHARTALASDGRPMATPTDGRASARRLEGGQGHTNVHNMRSPLLYGNFPQHVGARPLRVST